MHAGNGLPVLEGLEGDGHHIAVSRLTVIAYGVDLGQVAAQPLDDRVDIRVSHLHLFLIDGQSLVIGQFERRGVLEAEGIVQGLALFQEGLTHIYAGQGGDAQFAHGP